MTQIRQQSGGRMGSAVRRSVVCSVAVFLNFGTAATSGAYAGGPAIGFALPDRRADLTPLHEALPAARPRHRFQSLQQRSGDGGDVTLAAARPRRTVIKTTATPSAPDLAPAKVELTVAPLIPQPALFAAPSGAGPAYIEQIAEADTSLQPAQNVLLADQIAAMQVSTGPVDIPERSVLLAEAPSALTVRLGDTALGKVALQVTDTRAIAVQVGQLLDLVAGSYDSAQFARFRSSAAAQSFVTVEQLRAAGLKVRYDPVYDELRLDA